MGLALVLKCILIIKLELVQKYATAKQKLMIMKVNTRKHLWFNKTH